MSASDLNMSEEYDSCYDVSNSTSSFTSQTNTAVIYSMIGADQGLTNNCWNHPESALHPETFIKMHRILICGFGPSFFFIGAPPNIVTMIIFYRQGLRDRMNLCLFCLAFSDLMYVTSNMIAVSFCFIGLFIPSQELFWEITLICRSLNFSYGFLYLSGCLTMIIAVERCACVMFPLKGATLISTKNMAIVLSVTFFLIHGLCSVYAVKEEVSHVKDPVTGENMFSTTTSELYLNHSIFGIIENIVLSFIAFFCFVVVLIATIITVIQLQRAMSWRKSTASGSSHLKGQVVLVRMLVAVSCVYILCTVPGVALSLTRFTVPEFRSDGAQCGLFVAVQNINVITCMFNASINFFVYVTMSSRFRLEMKAIFVCSSAAIKRKTNKSESIY